LGVLIALAAQKPLATTEAHLSPEALAAFSEGHSSPEERERILAHLDACIDCYEEWLTATETLSDESLADVPASSMPINPPHRESVVPQTRSASSTPTVISLEQRRRQRIRWWSGTGMALAASLMLMLLAPWRNSLDLPSVLDDAYQSARDSAGSELRAIASREDPLNASTGSNYGFSASANTEAARAYTAGLWEGRAALSGPDHHGTPLPDALAPSPGQPANSSDWQRTEWSDYTVLGRWMFLLQTLCQADNQALPGIWDGQRDIAVQLRERLAKRPASDAKASPTVSVMRDLETALGDSGLSAGRRCLRLQEGYERLNALLTRTLLP
jgi:hypothetical protein